MVSFLKSCDYGRKAHIDAEKENKGLNWIKLRKGEGEDEFSHFYCLTKLNVLYLTAAMSFCLDWWPLAPLFQPLRECVTTLLPSSGRYKYDAVHDRLWWSFVTFSNAAKTWYIYLSCTDSWAPWHSACCPAGETEETGLDSHFYLVK